MSQMARNLPAVQHDDTYMLPLLIVVFLSSPVPFHQPLRTLLSHSSPHSWRHPYKIPLQASFPSHSTSLFPNDSDCCLATSIHFRGHDLHLVVTSNSWKTSLSILLFSDHSLHSSSSFTCQHFFTAPRQLFQPIFYSLPHLRSQLRLHSLTLQLVPCV